MAFNWPNFHRVLRKRSPKFEKTTYFPLKINKTKQNKNKTKKINKNLTQIIKKGNKKVYNTEINY